MVTQLGRFSALRGCCFPRLEPTCLSRGPTAHTTHLVNQSACGFPDLLLVTNYLTYHTLFFFPRPTGSLVSYMWVIRRQTSRPTPNTKLSWPHKSFHNHLMRATDPALNRRIMKYAPGRLRPI